MPEKEMVETNNNNEEGSDQAGTSHDGETANGEGNDDNPPPGPISINPVFSGLTPPPPALLRHEIPGGGQPFKSTYIAKMSTILICLGMIELVCGFAECLSVDHWSSTVYARAMMPLWTGILYILIAMIGFSASDSEKKHVIYGLLIITVMGIIMSVSLCAITLPGIDSYVAENCDNEDEQSGDSSESETACSEAHLVSALSIIAFVIAILSIFCCLFIAIMLGRFLCVCCRKKPTNVFQEAPIYFRVGSNGEMEATIITNNSSNPVIVSLPDYEKAMKGRKRVEVEQQICPSTPPPQYKSRENSIRRVDSVRRESVGEEEINRSYLNPSFEVNEEDSSFCNNSFSVIEEQPASINDVVIHQDNISIEMDVETDGCYPANKNAIEEVIDSERQDEIIQIKPNPRTTVVVDAVVHQLDTIEEL